MTMGFASKGEDKPECFHRDQWGLEVYGDHLFRTCFACGQVFLLTQIEGGSLAWERVLEPEETCDVADLPEEVPEVQGGKGKRSVPRGERRGRTRQLVQVVREPAAQSEVPTEKAATKRRSKKSHFEVLQPVQVREVAE